MILRKASLQIGNVDNIITLEDYLTSNDELLEKIVHNVLNIYRCKSGREHFFCNWKYIQLIIHIAGCFLDTLKSTYEYITKDELLQIINKKLSDFNFSNNSLNQNLIIAETSNNTIEQNLIINDITSNNFLITNNQLIQTLIFNNRENNIPIIAIFLRKIIDINNNFKKESIIFSSSKLFFLFNEFIKVNNYNIDYSATKFGLDIKNYDGIVKSRTKHGVDFNIIFLTLKKYLIKKYNMEF